ncbi:MAG: hypothetical protein WA602_07325, partial [Silvibacterium sp.]
MIQIGKAAIVAATFLLVPAFAQNITASEAAKHVGEQATVCGKIVSEHTASQSDGQPTFINLDRAYPNQEFTAVVWEKDKANVGKIPSSGDICVSGTITLYRGVPEVVVHDAKEWSLQTANQHPRTQLS